MAGENIGRNAAVIQPRAILLDIMLPDKDGWAILQELKGDPETQHIPVIIGSALQDQLMGARVGAADYLVKPIDAEVLMESLKKNTQLAVKP
jgi:DNA-binding response OmpR family regulator